MDKLKEGSDNVRDQIDNAGNKIDRFCMVVGFSFITVAKHIHIEIISIAEISY